jgi:hypothetical protein
MTNPTPSPLNPKKSTSPWVWVGLGCGTAVLLTFGGCIALFGVVSQKAVKELSKPVDQKEAVAELGDTPIYQPSTFNETITKGARLGSSLFPGKMVSAAAFDTSDAPNQVIDWYKQTLSAKGYRKAPGQPTLNSKSVQATFQRQSDGIIVQVDDASTASRKNYTLLLMRMKLPSAKQSP